MTTLEFVSVAMDEDESQAGLLDCRETEFSANASPPSRHIAGIQVRLYLLVELYVFNVLKSYCLLLHMKAKAYSHVLHNYILSVSRHVASYLVYSYMYRDM